MTKFSIFSSSSSSSSSSTMTDSKSNYLYLNTVVAYAEAKCSKDVPIPGLNIDYLYEGNKAVTGISLQRLTSTIKKTKKLVSRTIYPGFRNISDHVNTSHPPGHSWLPQTDGKLPEPDFKDKVETALAKLVPKNLENVILGFAFYNMDHSVATFIHQMHAYQVVVPKNVVAIRIVHMRGVMKSTVRRLDLPVTTEQTLAGSIIIDIRDMSRVLQAMYWTFAQIAFKEEQSRLLTETSHSVVSINTTLGQGYAKFLVDKIHSRPKMIIKLASMKLTPELVRDLYSREPKLNYKVVFESKHEQALEDDDISDLPDLEDDNDADNKEPSYIERSRKAGGIVDLNYYLNVGFLELSTDDIRILQASGINTVGELLKRSTDPVVRSIKRPLLQEFILLYSSRV